LVTLCSYPLFLHDALPILFAIVPVWLFFSVLVGWIAYLIVAVAIAKGSKMAYPLGLVLAVLTLAVSLLRPEHYSLVQAGLSLASDRKSTRLNSSHVKISYA